MQHQAQFLLTMMIERRVTFVTLLGILSAMTALRAPQPATFAALLNDLSKGPSNGIYTNLLDPPFSIDLNDPTSNTTPDTIIQ